MEFDLEHHIASLSRNIVIWAAILLAVLVIASVFLKERVPKLKPWLFGALAATLIIPTFFLIGSTIYLNVKSESGGPVHWHAGIEFWACGTELELRDPTGFLSNKIGTNTYHEHNDKFIHLEGVVVRKSEDASLGKFMRVVGGSLHENGIGVPLNEDKSTWVVQGDARDGDKQGALSPEELSRYVTHSPDGPVAQLNSGGSCGDQPADLQVFVYSFDKENNTYSQRKLDDPAGYVIRDESSLGPPSDCIIFEFDTPRSHTDRLCEQYGIRDAERCVEFGVKEHDPKICDIREVGKIDNQTPALDMPLFPTLRFSAAQARTCRQQSDTSQEPTALCKKLQEDCQNPHPLMGISSHCAILKGDIE